MTSSKKALLGCTAALAALAMATGALAQQRSFNIPAQDANRAVPEFARQAGVQIIAPGGELRGLRTHAVSGEQDVRAALRSLIQGTGLVIASDNGSVITLRRAQSPQDQGAASGPESIEVADVVVTGSRIRGAPPASPVIRLTQDAMRNAGQNNLGEAIRSLPQNFSGGQNPGIGLGSGNGNANIGATSHLNLRGLGADATLTLLNGHRLAYNGPRQGVDITAIPLDAVERVEILADGASALYGSDAVGGVANVILRRNYDGASLSARVGASTDGGNVQQQYGAFVGRTWDGGGAIATLNWDKSTAISARQRDYVTTQHPTAQIFPPIEAWQALVSGQHRLSARASLNADLLYSERSTNTSRPTTAVAPYTVQGVISLARTHSFTFAPNLDVALGGGWSANAAVTYGFDQTEQATTGFAASVVNVRQAVANENTTAVAELSAEGPLYRLPAGEVRLALGGGRRTVGYQQAVDINGTRNSSIDTDQNATFGYAELFVPIVDPDQNVSGVDRLSLTVAGRFEDYEALGTVAVPKVGVVYAPTSWLDLKLSWGRSFKGPILSQQFATNSVGYLPIAFVGTGYPSNATVLWRFGGNAGLRPERATTRAITAEFHPNSRPDLNFSISYFNVDYADRIIDPLPSLSGSINNPIYRPLYDLTPTSQEIADAVAAAGGPAAVLNVTAGPFNPASIVAILDARFRNASKQTISGVDLSASYRFDLSEFGSVNASGSITYLDSQQRLLPEQPEIDLSGTVFNPSRWRGRFGLNWEIGDLVLSPYATYVGSLRDTRFSSVTTLDSQVVFDLVARYTLTSSLSAFDGVELSASLLNVANTPPERVVTLSVSDRPFESTNYSAVGRYVGLQITKRW